MALSNAEKQARWRERHAMKRNAVQRISKAILRRQWNDDTIAELASALRQVLTTSGIAALRRALKPETMKEGLARQKEALRRELALWRREHPGKTAEDYWEWRKANGKADNLAERQAWERDHPGHEWPEHLCGLSDAEYVQYDRWHKRWEKGRRPRRAKPTGEANDCIRELLTFTSDYINRANAWREHQVKLDAADSEALWESIHRPLPDPRVGCARAASTGAALAAG